jgi:hypothetical protein
MQWGATWGGASSPPASLPPRVVVVNKRTAKTYRPEVALAPGPQTLAQPANGSLSDLYGAAWAVALYRDGPQLLQVQAGAWQPVEGGAALDGLDTGARHIALAFDQAARPVLAWESGGAVFVRQWDGSGGQYITRGPFVGRDPVLLADGPLLGAASESDVQLYLLDGSAVQLRLQRDLYGTAYPLGDVGTGAVLDQAVYAAHTVRLIGERAGAVWSLASRPYPLRAFDQLTGAALLSGWIEDLVKTAATAHGMTGGAALSGVLEAVSALMLYADQMSGAASLSGLLETVATQAALADSMTGAALLSGLLETAGIPVALSHTLTGGAALSGALETI